MTTVIVLSALAAALSLGAIIAVSLAVKKLNRGSSENGYEKFISELQKVNVSLSATIKAYTDAQERDFDNLAKRIESSGEKERAQQEKLHDVVPVVTPAIGSRWLRCGELYVSDARAIRAH